MDLKEISKKLINYEENKLYISVLFGKYGSGKTSIVLELKKMINTKVIYFLVTQKDKNLLISDWINELKKNFEENKIPKDIPAICEIIFLIMIFLNDQHITLIIDDFDKLFKVDKKSFYKIIHFMKEYKNNSNMHIIITTSNKNIIPIIPYDNMIDIEKLTYGKNFSKDIIYITGGVYKFANYLNNKNFTKLDDILKEIISKNSYIISEVENFIKETLGKNNYTYQGILQLIATGESISKRRLNNIIGRDVSGFLTKLEKDYNFIRSYKCLTNKSLRKSYIYEIENNILLFYYRYIFPNLYLLKQEKFEELIQKVKFDYKNFLIKVKSLQLIKKLEKKLLEYDVGKILIKHLLFIPLIGAINNKEKKLKIYLFKNYLKEFKNNFDEIRRLYKDYKVKVQVLK